MINLEDSLPGLGIVQVRTTATASEPRTSGTESVV